MDADMILLGMIRDTIPGLKERAADLLSSPSTENRTSGQSALAAMEVLKHLIAAVEISESRTDQLWLNALEAVPLSSFGAVSCLKSLCETLMQSLYARAVAEGASQLAAEERSASADHAADPTQN